MRSRIAPIVAALLAACAPSDTPAASGTSEAFRGWYEYGFETSRFVPCGADTAEWWVHGRDSGVSAALLARLRALEGRPDSLVGQGMAYAVFRGDTSAAGRYGHLESYDRELRLSTIDTLQLQPGADCPRPASRYGAT